MTKRLRRFAPFCLTSDGILAASACFRFHRCFKIRRLYTLDRGLSSVERNGRLEESCNDILTILICACPGLRM